MRHIGQQRKCKGPTGLELPEINAPAAPVDVIERQLPNITRAQPVAGRQQQDGVIPAAKRGRLIDCGQDAIDLCFAQHIRKVHKPILSWPWDCIAQGVRHPTLDGCPAKKDAEGTTIRTAWPTVACVLIELSNVPGCDETELGNADTLQVSGKRRELLRVLPRCLLSQPAMPPHKLQVQRQNRAEPRGRGRRASKATAKASLLICLKKDPDGRPKAAGSAGAVARDALSHVLPHTLRVRLRQQRVFVWLEAEGETQPFMQMLANDLGRIPQP